MLPIVAFRAGAEAELREAYSWYEDREPGLGSEFIRSLDACLQMIRRHPQMFPAVHGDIRKAVVRRFPYSIFYLAENESIVVLSVFHASRKPKRWMRDDPSG